MQDLVLDRYRLDRLLGAGGMADVWLATDTRTGMPVAVKRLHPHLAADPAMVERFEQEARATAAVRHPNTVGVLDAGRLVVVLEYVAGETLAERIRREPVGPAEVQRIGAEIGSALAAVHAAGIVHRDVTPGNVMLDREGRARLADFGIARPLEAPAGLTSTGDLIGTWRFVAPEVLDGGAAGPPSDVWALGATLYEALTGVPPYPATSPAELVAARHAPPPHLGRGVLATLITRMLDPDPLARPAARDVARALAPSPEAMTEILRLPSAATDGDQARWAGGSSAPLLLAPARTPAAPPVRRRHSGVARQAAVAAAGVLVAAGAALAAAAPAEPPAAAGAVPLGPFPLPSTAAASPSPLPTPGSKRITISPVSATPVSTTPRQPAAARGKHGHPGKGHGRSKERRHGPPARRPNRGHHGGGGGQQEHKPHGHGGGGDGGQGGGTQDS